MSWAKQEFETIELGDARLNQRAVLLAERLGQKPGASIPGVQISDVRAHTVRLDVISSLNRY